MILKRDSEHKSGIELAQLYLKARRTFHVLMCRLGQLTTYETIIELYKKLRNEQGVFENDERAMTPVHETVMKLLIRCALGYESIHRVRKIFKMINRHNQMNEIL